MLAKELISDIIPAIRTQDTGLKALNWMEIFRISHLPIIDEEEFMGLISDSDIYDFNQVDEKIGNHKLSLIRPFVYEDQHVYDITSIVSRMGISIVPVLDKKNKYLGVITLHDLVRYFADFSAVKNMGAVIILEMSIHDYSLTEIANIVESNEVKILSSYIRELPESTKMEVILKLNKQEIASVLQTFERYEYHVKASYSDDETVQDFLNDRYDSFLNYLNL